MSGIIFKLRDMRGLPRREMVVLKELAIFADENGRAWPSNRALARNTGFGVRTVQKALEVLQELELIEIERTGFINDDKQFVALSRVIQLLPENWGRYLSESNPDGTNPGGMVKLTDKEAAARNLKIKRNGDPGAYA